MCWLAVGARRRVGDGGLNGKPVRSMSSAWVYSGAAPATVSEERVTNGHWAFAWEGVARFGSSTARHSRARIPACC